MIASDKVRWDDEGLVPAVVQDATDGQVLMLAYIDSEALAATVETGEVHFHSRSRGRLWRKGETSGNVLRLRSASLDCDGDALLLTVDPAGPTCHRGTRSCFDLKDAGRAQEDSGAQEASGARQQAQGFAWLEEVWRTIQDRARTRPSGSYTAELLSGGVDRIGRKVTEEATEVLIAAKNDAAAETLGGHVPTSKEALAGEAADLVYHLLVLLAERGSSPAEVVAQLQRRHAS